MRHEWNEMNGAPSASAVSSSTKTKFSFSRCARWKLVCCLRGAASSALWVGYGLRPSNAQPFHSNTLCFHFSLLVCFHSIAPAKTGSPTLFVLFYWRSKVKWKEVGLLLELGHSIITNNPQPIDEINGVKGQRAGRQPTHFTSPNQKFYFQFVSWNEMNGINWYYKSKVNWLKWKKNMNLWMFWWNEINSLPLPNQQKWNSFQFSSLEWADWLNFLGWRASRPRP